MPEDQLFSTTIQRGKKWGNVLGHDPLTEDEINNAPFMGQEYDTEDEALKAAADEAQADYDRQRRDPQSSWHNPGLNPGSSIQPGALRGLMDGPSSGQFP